MERKYGTTWEYFKEAFNEKYFPRSFHDEKWNEFLQLVQEPMSVAEYERNTLSCLSMLLA